MDLAWQSLKVLKGTCGVKHVYSHYIEVCGQQLEISLASVEDLDDAWVFKESF